MAWAGQSFPDDLQSKLDAAGYRWHVVNLGISGDTTEGGVSRIDSATSLKPAIVMLELGGNDGLRGLPLQRTRAESRTDDRGVSAARERRWCSPA